MLAPQDEDGAVDDAHVERLFVRQRVALGLQVTRLAVGQILAVGRLHCHGAVPTPLQVKHRVL